MKANVQPLVMQNLSKWKHVILLVSFFLVQFSIVPLFKSLFTTRWSLHVCSSISAANIVEKKRTNVWEKYQSSHSSACAKKACTRTLKQAQEMCGNICRGWCMKLPCQEKYLHFSKLKHNSSNVCNIVKIIGYIYRYREILFAVYFVLCRLRTTQFLNFEWQYLSFPCFFHVDQSI